MGLLWPFPADLICNRTSQLFVRERFSLNLKCNGGDEFSKCCLSVLTFDTQRVERTLESAVRLDALSNARDQVLCILIFSCFPRALLMIIEKLPYSHISAGLRSPTPFFSMLAKPIAGAYALRVALYTSSGVLLQIF